MTTKAEPASLPQAHSGTLRQFVRYARTTGLDLEACLDADLMGWVERAETIEFLPAHVMVDVLEICAAAGQRPDLGIAFAAWSNLRGYGPISLMWDHCPTLRELVRITGRYLTFENAALGTTLDEDGQEVALRSFIAVPARYGSRQLVEAALAFGVCISRMMFGPNWTPLRVELAHGRPRAERYRNSFFGAPIEYGASRNALIIPREEMDWIQPNANAPMLAYLEQQHEKLAQSHPRNFPDHVEQVIAAHLPGGAAKLDHVASMLALSRRTLQRRLTENGVRFGDIQTRVRQRVAREYFANETQPNLTELAYRLGYGDASVAGRFLSQHVASARLLRRHKA